MHHQDETQTTKMTSSVPNDCNVDSLSRGTTAAPAASNSTRPLPASRDKQRNGLTPANKPPRGDNPNKKHAHMTSFAAQPVKRRPQRPHRAKDPHILRGSYTMDNDPFKTILRCRSLPPRTQLRILEWHGECPRYTSEQENALKPILLAKQADERGMVLHQPPDRLADIVRACKDQNVPLFVALSFRRHCIKWNHPQLKMQDLELGDDELIRKSALRFERAVADYLQQQQVRYYGEREQRNSVRSGQHPYPPTPDFILHHPVGVRMVPKLDGGSSHGETRVHHIHWVEAKMYYGANSVPWDDARTANGTIFSTAEKYVRVFGPGAIVFMYGCGQDLADRLMSMGVVALDGSTGNLELKKVHAHQRTWCANAEGHILP